MHRVDSRPLLPQSIPMSTFSFAPPNMGFGDIKKNYVFVDEHNRHKRLKVMRACEGCRRRKIKCDAATTNSWPCAACVRLKLTCIPPTVNYNRTSTGMQQATGLERVLDFATDSSDASGDEGGYIPHQPMLRSVYSHSPELMAPQQPYSNGLLSYPGSPASIHSEPYFQHHHHHDSITSVPLVTSAAYSSSYQTHMPSSNNIHIVDSTSDAWPRDELTPHVPDVLGELKIEPNALAPYIVHQKRSLAEVPALEEAEYSLPSISAIQGSAVRIPQELLPDDAQALEYFDIFFNNIHPYVPVISKSYFFQQWNNNRNLISPLLLEAIFACAGRNSSDPAQGAQWLALASKHETCFMDVPRLSTLQALLILLKAREATAKRGYYYRSWMALKTICSMAKDLELDEHYALHQRGQLCDDSRECLVKTRIWQTIFVGEVMVGGPQGRYDMGVDVDTVDFSAPATPPGGDDEEYTISRNFTYFVKTIRNARSEIDVYRQIKKEKDWNTHPMLTALNPVFPTWLAELPIEMQIHLPANGSQPYIASHFLANIHCYHYLSILMLHRPQLKSADFTDGSWKTEMSVCNEAARAICRIQEATLRDYGIDGFLYMQRGINFAIYCILTSVMIHLAATTAPDPEFSNDARDYLTRHMRLLESCAPAWPAQDLQAQILSLRQAFSVDLNKPFELKAVLPPSTGFDIFSSPSPGPETYDHGIVNSSSNMMHNLNAQPMTPPISSAGNFDDGRDTSLAATSLPMLVTGRSTSLPGSEIGEHVGSWNPTRLFDQWHSAFGTPPPSHMSGSPSLAQAPFSPTGSVSSHDFPLLSETIAQPSFSITSNMTSHPLQAGNSYSPPTSYPNSYVSPSMWRESVAGTYSAPTGILKRRWTDTDQTPWLGSNDYHVKRLRQ